MDAAEAYANQVDRVVAQRTRLHGGEIQDDSWGGTTAKRFRFDPRRQLGANIVAGELCASRFLKWVAGVGPGRCGTNADFNYGS